MAEGKQQYNPKKHHRKSTRLQGYDYAAAGLYFITLCTYNRLCLFGEVVAENMVLNKAGLIAETCWSCIPDHFPRVVLHAHIIMPNHVHGIIELTHDQSLLKDWPQQNKFGFIIPDSVGSIVKGFKVGVTKWFRYGINPVETKSLDPTGTRGSGLVGAQCSGPVGAQHLAPQQNFGPGQDISPQQHLSDQQSKTPVWQRNFHDHIIRNAAEYYRIRNYILNNPKNWDKDKFYENK